MDTLVARYTRPAFERTGWLEEQQELAQNTPPLSLRFALPPIANVSIFRACLSLLGRFLFAWNVQGISPWGSAVKALPLKAGITRADQEEVYVGAMRRTDLGNETCRGENS
jgi:hypothetical protein